MLAIGRCGAWRRATGVGRRSLVIPSQRLDELDAHILATAHHLLLTKPISLHDIISQFHERRDRVLDLVLPYEAYPSQDKRADVVDGTVMIAHIALQNDGTVGKLVVCSGFAVNVQGLDDGDVIVSCAHTIQEVHREMDPKASATLSIVFPSQAPPRPVSAVLASLPRRDLVVLQSQRIAESQPLPTLPVSPYALGHRHLLMGHIVGSPAIPAARYSKADRLREEASAETAQTQRWVGDLGWIRWCKAEMLGYRDGQGREVERGTAEPLPHMLTSLLPTPGSSGGPIIDAVHGSVVGVFSGTRMDNWVEGERGWGATAEGIFEMFSLPGFKPASLTRK